MLSDAQVSEFHQNGFVNGGPALTDAQVEELRNELTRVIDEQDRDDVAQPVSLRNLSGDDAHPVWQVVNIYDASPAYRALISNPVIVEAALQLLDAQEIRVWHDQIQFKPADVGGVNRWHQDSPLWPILTPKTTQLSAWIALDDVDHENGCMSMVPGSHKWGPVQQYLETFPGFDSLPDSYEGNAVDGVLCPVRKGNVHFHDALTWHASHQNTSGRPRRAIAVHFMSEKTMYNASGDHLMKAFVTVADGEQLTGERFPLVGSRELAPA